MDPKFPPHTVTRPNQFLNSPQNVRRPIQVINSPSGHTSSSSGHVNSPSGNIISPNRHISSPSANLMQPMLNINTSTEHTRHSPASTPEKFVSHAHFEMEIKDSNHIEQNHIQHPSQLLNPGLNQNWPHSQVPMNNVDEDTGEDDLAYTQALLSHQKARMEKLSSDLQQSHNTLMALRLEVNQLERGQQESVRSKNLPTAEDIQNMRESNRKLQVDVQMLAREIDIFNNGQTPLGVVNVNTDQHFYQNIFNGQQGPLYQSKGPKKPTGHPPLPPKRPAALPPPSHPPPRPPPPTVARQPDKEEGDGENWACSACTFLNHPALDKCECCEMPRISAKNTT